MFKFIHKAAVKNYKQELNDLTETYSNIGKEQLADFFIMSVWTRAGMQNEGVFKYPDGQKYDLPYLSGYPILWSSFENIVKAFRRQGLNAEATAISIWVHTCRGLLYYGEMQAELDKLWQLLMSTQDLWDKYLDKYYNDDKERLNPEMLNETLSLSKEILKNLPPKQSWEHDK